MAGFEQKRMAEARRRLVNVLNRGGHPNNIADLRLLEGARKTRLATWRITKSKPFHGEPLQPAADDFTEIAQAPHPHVAGMMTGRLMRTEVKRSSDRKLTVPPSASTASRMESAT
eukprot:scaffold79342_cov29-Tisochrysis_lutea.AAC.3